MDNITFEDKVAINTNANIPEINKVQDSDLNEIKEVVNNNANSCGNLSDLETSDTSSLVNAINELTNNWEGTILFSSNGGTTTTFTLNDSVSNYSKLLVTYGRNNGAQKTSVLLDINNIGSTSIPLSIVDAGGNNFLIYGCRISFSGNRATISNNGARVALASSNTFSGSGFQIGIHKVIAYK